MADDDSGEDCASVDRAEAAMEAAGWRRLSLGQVIDQWAAFVARVEVGYELTIDDYTNDLSIRLWPEQARRHLSSNVGRWVDDRLRPLDERLRIATHPVGRRLPGAGTEWWWEARLPNVLVDELEEDVRRMKLEGA